MKKIIALVLLLLTGSASAVTFTQGYHIQSGDTSYEGKDVVVSGATLTIDGSHSFTSFKVINGGVITSSAGVSSQITSSIIQVASGALINLSAKGKYPTNEISSRSGGSYGGQGGVTSGGTTNAGYGDYMTPTDMGTGGYGGSSSSRNRGGGALKLSADELVLDGDIVADGGYQRYAGGGSGGSIWLDVGVLSGSGQIRANGGAGGNYYSNSSGGGGGRIAIYFDDASGFDFASQVKAYGGQGRSSSGVSGGAGTIYLKNATSNVGDISIVNRSDFTNMAQTAIADTSLGKIDITNAYVVMRGDMKFSGVLNDGGIVWSDGGHVAIDGDLIAINEAIFHSFVGQVIDLSARKVSVDATSRFELSARGNYPSNTVSSRSGGSYGGQGGVTSGGTTNAGYGDYMTPTDMGTGGYGGSSSSRNRGGGALKLSADELVLDGDIVADGGYQRYAGGGSGGSIWLDVGVIAGSGQIQANGGRGGDSYTNTSGGGGGRIAIYFDDASGFDFASQVKAYGGGASSSSGQNGAAGTIYFESVSESPGELVIASKTMDASGAVTGITGNYSGGLRAVNSRVSISSAMNLHYLRNEGARVWTNGELLTVSGNISLVSGGQINSANEKPLSIIAEKVYVENGSAFNVLGRGSRPSNDVSSRSGGSYGGQGGVTSGGTTNAGYGDYMTPTDMGTGGYGGSSSSRNRGGGALKLSADELVLDGDIVADGGYQRYAGGGSGGSIWLDVGVIAGSGQIQANGGRGGDSYINTSGGGGGRIAVYYGDASGFDLDNNITALGGSGNSSGSDGENGTVYLGEKNYAPYVLSHSPKSVTSEPVSIIKLRFSTEIDAATFDSSAFRVLKSYEIPYTAEVVRVSPIDYELRFDPALEDGTYHVILTSDITGTNGFSLVSEPGSVAGDNPYPYEFDVEVDTKAPSVPTVTNYSSSPEENVVTSRQIELVGTRDAGSSIWINGKQQLGGGATDWSLTYSLPEGATILRVQAGDAAGNLSEPLLLQFIADTVPPVVSSVNPANNTYLSYRPSEIRISFVEEASGVDLTASLLSVSRNGDGVDGEWHIDGTELVFIPSLSALDGIYSVDAQLHDVAGHVSSPAHFSFVVDTVPPAAPVITSAPDNTTINSATINGSKEPESKIVLNGEDLTPINSELEWSTSLSLSPGINSYSFKAVDMAGNESQPVLHEIVFDDTAPGPIPLVVEDIGSGTSLELSWAEYDEWSQGNDIDHYNIYAEEGAFDTASAITPRATVTGGIQSFTLDGLTRGTTYYLAVVAVDGSGNSVDTVSPVVSVPNDTTAPEETSGLKVQVTSDTIHLSWDASENSAADLSAYRLYRDGELVGEVDTATLDYLFDGLSPATSYALKVKALDESGNESDGVSVNGVTLIPNPAGLAAEPHSGLVDLTWDASVSETYVDYYAVYAADADFIDVSSLQPVVTAPSGTHSAKVGGLEDDIPYFFAVTAVNLSGGETEQVSAITATPHPDREGPVVGEWSYDGTIVSEGGVISTSGVLQVAANDPIGVSRVKFELDGEVFSQDLSASDGFTAALNLYQVEDGTHSFGVTAYDTLDNATSETINLNISLVAPPTPVLTTPSDGESTNRTVTNVVGSAEPYSDVSLQLNGEPLPDVIATDDAGAFSATVSLTEGANEISAMASNRGGSSDYSEPVGVTVDTTIPGAPSGLIAKGESQGRIVLSWNLSSDRNVSGYDIYRSTQSFEDISAAVKVNSAVVDSSRYTDMPVTDGVYFYRVVAVNELGTPSEASNSVSATADTDLPRVLSIEYAPQGSVDPVTGTIAPGRVDLTVTLNEELLTTPFISITPDGGVPMNVVLDKITETEYQGYFTVTDSTVSGTGYAIFSGRDLVGNRGTEIDSGATLQFDTDGPEVSSIKIVPADPIKNDSVEPVTVTAEFSLDQAVKSGTMPSIAYRLSESTSVEVPVDSIIAVDEQTWRASITLPAEAGAGGVENLSFAYSAYDDLDNLGDTVRGGNSFQVYQGDLPPLATPYGLKATALSGGQVKLEWGIVEDAVAYQLYRQGPDGSTPTPYKRIDQTQYIDTTALDGNYHYSVASIRNENGQEALSAQSDTVVVSADSTAPAAPQNLSLELVGSGIKALWQESPESGGNLSYRLYRSGGELVASKDTATLVQSNIVANSQGLLGFIDSAPDQFEPAYAVTAVDESGNESELSVSAYLNVELLPVASLTLNISEGAYPVLNWSHNGGNVSGYNVYLGDDGADGDPLNSSPMLQTSYTDSGYTSGERIYTVTAVDINGVESIGRSVQLPSISVELDDTSTIKRGIFNQIDYRVTNNGSTEIDGLSIVSTLGGHTNRSSSYTVASGETITVPVVVGGFADLPGLADLVTSTQVVATTGEKVVSESLLQREVGDSALVLGVQTQEMLRGTAGQARFTLENTSDVTSEVITALQSGNRNSSDIHLELRDSDGNVLSTAPFRQATGDKVLTLSNSNTVARVAPGERFTSAWVDIPVPENAPDSVTVNLVIDRLHYHTGRSDHVAIGGLQANTSVSLVDTAYSATVSSVSPQRSSGDEPVVISGEALSRSGGGPVAGVPVKLVVEVDGFERTSRVTTDSQGQYEYSYTPLAGESGVFTVSAIHPDMLSRPSQAEFVVTKVDVTPNVMNLSMPYGKENHFNVIEAKTGDETPATNLYLEYVAADQTQGVLPEGVSVVLPESISLAANSSASLPVTITADDAAAAEGAIVLNAYSDESAGSSLGRITINYEFYHPAAAKPALYFTPNYAEGGVGQGKGISDTITLLNKGRAAMEDVVVSLLTDTDEPAPDWIYLTSPSAQGSIAPGGEKPINFTVRPGTSVPEGNYAFKLRVTSSNYAVTDINIFITVTSPTAGGDALFKVSDIYTATLDDKGQPIHGLSGARIRVQNEQDLSVERSLITDSLGEAMFENLPAGRYVYRASASNHQDELGYFTVEPGVIATEEVFLEYNLVTVEWSVVEITLEDKYEVTLETTFETDVPAAVLVIEPTSTTLPQMAPGEVFQGELRLTNYGLIRADNLQFNFPGEDSYFRYEFQGGLPDSLEAKESIVIPYRVIALSATESDGTGTGGVCSTYMQSMQASGDYVCANGQVSSSRATHAWTQPANCNTPDGESAGDEPIIYTGGAGGGGGYGGGGTSGGPLPTSGNYSSIAGAQCIPEPPECPVCEALKQFGGGQAGGAFGSGGLSGSGPLQ